MFVEPTAHCQPTNPVTPSVPELFRADHESDLPFWTCVRTRPRWEKKFASYLNSRRVPAFLPTVVSVTRSHRKTQVSGKLLFDGFVFVKGDYTKQCFVESGCVVYVLKPRTPRERAVLARQLRSVWQLTNAVTAAERENEFRVGELVTVASGCLSGVSGVVRHVGKSNKLTVWVDTLGVGVSAVLEAGTQFVRNAAESADGGRDTQRLLRSRAPEDEGSAGAP